MYTFVTSIQTLVGNPETNCSVPYTNPYTNHNIYANMNLTTTIDWITNKG